ncbi:MAG: hypothetical protein GF331_17915 [Chitinivibrionales bacterium]|nr:hypothetical protein [Chitinivibrionales bacterium]
MSRTFLIGLVIAGFASAQSSMLVSQLRTNYTAGGTTYAFQWYTYDSNGRLTYASAYDGADTLSALSSVRQYAYDGAGKLTGEAVVMQGDTLYELRYAYGLGDNLIEVRRLNASGSVTYIDSLEYDAGDRLVRTERWDNTGATLRYFHNLRRDPDGNVVSDTLYEPDGSGGFIAKQATMFTHAADGRVLTEDAWREQSGWYQISQTILTYDSNDWLVSRAKYEGTGASGVLLDSLAYTNDSHGNRIVELHYDDERTLTYRIDSVWDFQTVVAFGCSPRNRPAGRSARAAMTDGAVVSLYRMDGRLVGRAHSYRGDRAHSSARPGAGAYAARIARGNMVETTSVTSLR